MPKPQLENGYTPIANEIMDELCKTRINGEARQCLDFILRKTYGYHKKEDRISLSQFVTGTGMQKNTVCKAISKLKSINLILVTETEKGNVYKFQKNSDEWKPLPKKGTLPKKGIGITQKVNERYPKSDIQKIIIQKKLIQKKDMLSKKKTIKDLEDEKLIITGDIYKPDYKSLLDIKLDKKYKGSEFGNKCVWLGYQFNEYYLERFKEKYKKGNFSVSGISKNIAKYEELAKDDWIKVIEYYFSSKKAQDLVVTLEACFSENTLLEYKQKNKQTKDYIYLNGNI